MDTTKRLTIAVVIFAGVLCIIVALLVFLKMQVARNKGRFERSLGRTLNRTVEIGKVNLEVFPHVRLRMGEVHVFQKTDETRKPTMDIPVMYATMSIPTFLLSQKVAIKAVELKRATVHYGIEGKAIRQLSGVVWKTGLLNKVYVHLEGDTGIDAVKDFLLTGNMVLRDEKFALSSTDFDLSLQLNDTPTASICPQLPEKFPFAFTRSRLSTVLNIKGSLDSRLAVDGYIDLRNIDFVHIPKKERDMFLKMRWDCNVAFDRNKVDILESRVVLGEDEITVSGGVDLKTSRKPLILKLRSEKFNVKHLKGLFRKLDYLKVYGSTAIDAVLEIDTAPFAKLRYRSRIDFQDLQGYVDPFISEIRKISGRVDFDNTKVSLKNVTVEFSESLLKLNMGVERKDGTLTFVGKGTCPRLNIADFFVKQLGSPSPPSADVSDTDGGAEPEAESKPKQRDTIFVSVDLTAWRAGYADLDFVNLKTHIEYRDGVLSLGDLQSNFYDGRLELSGNLRYTGTVPTFTTEGRLIEIDMNSLLSRTTTLADRVAGVFNADFSVTGEGKGFTAITDSLQGEGYVALVNGDLVFVNLLGELLKGLAVDPIMSGFILEMLTEAGMDETTHTYFNILNSPVRFREGRILADKVTLESDDMDIRAKGSLGYDKSLDFEGEVLLSREQSHEMKEGIKAISKLLDNRNGRLVIPFTLTGSINNPKPVPRIKRFQDSLESFLDEEIFHKKASEGTGGDKTSDNGEGGEKSDDREFDERLEKYKEKIIKEILK